jgi:hypothetical protein
MTFDEWWEQRSPYMPHLMDDFEDWPSEWKVKELAREAFLLGYEEGYNFNNLEGHLNGKT